MLYQWANVFFTDEKRFKVHGNDGNTRVYDRRDERFAGACIIENDGHTAHDLGCNILTPQKTSHNCEWQLKRTKVSE